MNGLSQNQIQSIKKLYPKGTRIVLDRMYDDPRPVAPGTRGVVELVDDLGTIHCSFENGRHLGIVPDVDEFHVG